MTKETGQLVAGCDSKELEIRNIFGMYWLKTEIRVRWSKCININFLFVFKFASSVGNVLRLCDYLVPPQIFT